MILIHEGNFGIAIANQYADSWRETLTVAEFLDTPERVKPQPDELVVVMLTNKRIAATRKLERYFLKHEIRWTLSFLNDRYLYCGPYFVPKKSACFDCFHRRDLTHLKHHQTAERELAIESHFSRHPDEQISGFTNGTTAMAVGFAMLCDQGKVAPGKLRRVNLVDGPIEDTNVISIHNCRVCRPHDEDYYSSRFVSHLIPELREELK